MIYKYTLVDPITTISLDYKGGAARRRLMKKGDYHETFRELPLEEADQYGLTTYSRSVGNWKFNVRLCVQFLRACKQINAEATTMLYAENHIAFIDMRALGFFLEQIGDSNIQQL